MNHGIEKLLGLFISHNNYNCMSVIVYSSNVLVKYARITSHRNQRFSLVLIS